MFDTKLPFEWCSGVESIYKAQKVELFDLRAYLESCDMDR